MYIKSTHKKKSYFIHRFRFFFQVAFSFFFTLSFSGCWILRLLSADYNSSKEKHITTNSGGAEENAYNNGTTELIKNEENYSPDDCYIDIDEDIEIYSLKKSEIVFLGRSDVKDATVSFQQGFLNLLSEKYIGKFFTEKTIYDLLNYITLYYHSRVDDKSFLERKRIKMNNLNNEYDAKNSIVDTHGFNGMRLYLLGENDDTTKSIFKYFSSNPAPSAIDTATTKLFFVEFPYLVQILICQKYERYLTVCPIINNDAILLVYDVNDKSSFDCLNNIIDYFSKDDSKHIFFILGSETKDKNTDEKEFVEDEYVISWCKRKEEQINSGGMASDKESVENNTNSTNTDLRRDRRFKK